MAEYIERKNLIAEIGVVISRIKRNPYDSKDETKGTLCGLAHAIGCIKSHPTADVVEVVHAEWIKAGFGISERVVCSHCRSHHGSYLKPPFCSQCGAKMDGERR